MKAALLEHVNYTVSDADQTAATLCQLFGWKIRWSGQSLGNGRSVHVGSDERYLALYTPGEAGDPSDDNYQVKGGLNHLGILVDDLDAAETRVKEAGFVPHSQQEYDPGKRFYFHDSDGIEYEVVSYSG